jgi:hypothetical protein
MWIVIALALTIFVGVPALLLLATGFDWLGVAFAWLADALRAADSWFNFFGGAR